MQIKSFRRCAITYRQAADMSGDYATLTAIGQLAQEEIDSIQLGSTALYKWAKPITIFANSIYRRR